MNFRSFPDRISVTLRGKQLFLRGYCKIKPMQTDPTFRHKIASTIGNNMGPFLSGQFYRLMDSFLKIYPFFNALMKCISVEKQRIPVVRKRIATDTKNTKTHQNNTAIHVVAILLFEVQVLFRTDSRSRFEAAKSRVIDKKPP